MRNFFPAKELKDIFVAFEV